MEISIGRNYIVSSFSLSAIEYGFGHLVFASTKAVDFDADCVLIARSMIAFTLAYVRDKGAEYWDF